MRWLLAGASVWAVAACTSLPGPPIATPWLADGNGCHAWVAALDAAVARASVADAEAARLAGVPGLRVDRPLQALRERAGEGGDAWRAWLRHAAALDRQARVAEIGNLPAAAFPIVVLGDSADSGGAAGAAGTASPGAADRAADRAAALARTDGCREDLLRQLEAAPAPLRAEVLARAEVPERYSTGLRAAGLYPLLRWPFFAGVQRWQAAHEAEMVRWAAATPPLQRYVSAEEGAPSAPRAPSMPSAPVVPAASPAPVAPVAPEAPEAPSAAAIPRDALGMPQPAPQLARRLLAWHAPVFEIEERGAFDRFGVPTWSGRDAAAPRVDTAQPVVYTRLAHTRFEGRWRLQLVYTLWFPERPARSSLDLLAGTLDGVIVRLTLDDDGEPLLMDTIHACGCYHLFFPSAALQTRAGAPQSEEWLFAPGALPRPVGRDARLVVRLASGSHYVTGVAALPRRASAAEGGAGTREGQGARRYALRDENALRSLPLADAPAERRSLYGPDGLVAGSERGERFLFWPMGIASAGAMRQWGHHATAFVGRRHFDDVDLVEQRFVRAAAPSRPQP